MKLSTVSIERPVLAIVMSLLLVVLGLMAFNYLTLRELPAIDPPVVSVSVDYTGASAAVVETRITQVLEDALAGIEGIDTINASSRNGRARVSIEFSASRDIEAAANDVRDAVSRIADRLPEEARTPEIFKVESDADPIIWFNLSSSHLDTLALSDYAERYVVDRFSSLDGVAQVRISGRQRYAMRIWLDRDQLAARNLTVAEVEAALRNENVELPAGRIESATRDFTVRVERSYESAQDFARLPLAKGADGYVVRLGDVAQVELASAERRAYYRSNGEPGIGLGIVKTSTANALDVARTARAQAQLIGKTLPQDMQIFVSFDNTAFIEAAVKRVYATLLEAVLLVLLVIWLFLGSARAALVPAVTVPVCLIAAFIALWAFGFSINLFTLLALVLCIGLVVDDAIVVVENVQRRIDLGEPPLAAAKRGTSQVAFAVIATTAVLVAVFLPVGFLQGNTGRLFRELAVALAAAIALSAFVALSLTPMMASRLLRPHNHQEKSHFLHNVIERIAQRYARFLQRHIQRTNLFVLLMLVALLASVGLYRMLPQELAPAEDRGSFMLMIDGPEGAGYDYTVAQVQQIESIIEPMIAQLGNENAPIMRANPRVPGGWGNSEEMHTARMIAILQPWQQRQQSTPDVAAQVQQSLSGLTGVRTRAQVSGGLVRSFGQPFQMVLGGSSHEEIAQWRDSLLERMNAYPGLLGVDSDYKETRPQMQVNIDRQRAADLGISVTSIGRALETLLGSRRVTTFVNNGEEYDVLLQAGRENRATPADLAAIHVRGASGELVPLSNLVSLSEMAQAGTLNRFNRLRAITLSASLAPGYTMGEVVNWAQQAARETLPDYAQIDWKGESREFQRSGGAALLTFAMALLVVYLVLAAQFESFIHPLTIMLTVPLAVLGAFLGLYLTGGSLNLFSQIGIVMLIGLAAKNGILIVEFANQLRDTGRSVQQAIIQSAHVRLRPVLMTSIATVVGAIPLVMAGGPGSASRATIGVVVIFGVTLSTFLSLFVIPAFYALLAPYTHSPQAGARELAKQEQQSPPLSDHI